MDDNESKAEHHKWRLYMRRPTDKRDGRVIAECLHTRMAFRRCISEKDRLREELIRQAAGGGRLTAPQTLLCETMHGVGQTGRQIVKARDRSAVTPTNRSHDQTRLTRLSCDDLFTLYMCYWQTTLAFMWLEVWDC
ncbi:hypothetical protein J6590_024666 [Homalodisca vitripennis]|nr:hypothetical protein J6590_024666 [Homalodisca vitripennis]